MKLYEFGRHDRFPALVQTMERMYERPKAPPRVAAAFAALRG
jgi:hypothetical protein